MEAGGWPDIRNVTAELLRLSRVAKKRGEWRKHLAR